jgi:hypothetical protein
MVEDPDYFVISFHRDVNKSSLVWNLKSGKD